MILVVELLGTTVVCFRSSCTEQSKIYVCLKYFHFRDKGYIGYNAIWISQFVTLPYQQSLSSSLFSFVTKWPLSLFLCTACRNTMNAFDERLSESVCTFLYDFQLSLCLLSDTFWNSYKNFWLGMTLLTN